MPVADFSSTRDARGRSLATALLFALVLHVPLTPFPFILRWRSAHLRPSAPSWDYKNDSVIFPVSWVDEPSETKRSPIVEPGAPPTQAKASSEGPLAPTPRDAGVVGAHAPDAARTVDAVPRRRGPESGAPLAALDALGVVGGSKRVINEKPGVSLVVWFSTVREHALGDEITSLLACSPHWRDVLGDEVEPLQDIDGVMLTGPRLSDASKLTMLVQFKDETQADQILDALAQKPGGPPVDAGTGSHAARF